MSEKVFPKCGNPGFIKLSVFMISKFSSLGLHDSEVDSLMQIIRWNLQNMISIRCTSADESFLQTPSNTPAYTAQQKGVVSFPIIGVGHQGCTKVGDMNAWISLCSCQVDLLVREDICALTMAIKRKAITTCSYRSTSIFYQKDQSAVSSVCSKFQSFQLHG